MKLLIPKVRCCTCLMSPLSNPPHFLWTMNVRWMFSDVMFLQHAQETPIHHMEVQRYKELWHSNPKKIHKLCLRWVYTLQNSLILIWRKSELLFCILQLHTDSLVKKKNLSCLIFLAIWYLNNNILNTSGDNRWLLRVLFTGFWKQCVNIYSLTSALLLL